MIICWKHIDFGCITSEFKDESKTMSNWWIQVGLSSKIIWLYSATDRSQRHPYGVQRSTQNHPLLQIPYQTPKLMQQTSPETNNWRTKTQSWWKDCSVEVEIREKCSEKQKRTQLMGVGRKRWIEKWEWKVWRWVWSKIRIGSWGRVRPNKIRFRTNLFLKLLQFGCRALRRIPQPN